MPSKTSHLLRLFGLALLGITVLASAHPASAGDKTLTVGSSFPSLSDFDLEGDLPDLSDARVVIIDFWASWCGPCKASFPVYSELQDQFGSKGVVVIAVNVDKSPKDMQKFIKRNPPSFSVVRDAKQQLVGTVGVPTMPTAFVLDSTGVVRFVHAGFHNEKSRREYIHEIKTLLEEQS